MANEDNDGSSTTPPVPAIIRTVVYLAGALGTVAVIVGVEDPYLTWAKVAMGVASLLGFTFNPAFGVGSKK